MVIYIGGEDDVTREIAKRLAAYCYDGDLQFITVAARDNGAKALRNLDKLVALGNEVPVISVYDSDGDCAITFLRKHTANGWKSVKTAINIAVPEAEGWLIADIKGLSRYLRIRLSDISQICVENGEIANSISYKASLYLCLELAPKSASKKIREELASNDARKPSTYNSVIVPFIRNNWNIEEAMRNSDSLVSAVSRIRKLLSPSLPS